MGEYFSLERVIEYFPTIIASFPVTLLIVVVATVVGALLGILLAFVRIYKIPILRQIATIYISFIRGTPLIVQLFIVYYGVPMLVENLFGLNLNRVDAIYFVLIAYGLNEGAFMSEIFRGGLSAIPAGQTEAGYAVGLTKAQTFFRVIMPQAVRIVLPSFGVEIVMLFQNTSLASSVGVKDLMGRAGLMGAATFHYIENYFCAAVIFIVVSIVLEMAFQKLSRKIDFTKKEAKS